METQPCLLCRTPLKAPGGINTTGDPAIALFMFASSVGMRPRLKSPAKRFPFCVPCMNSLATGAPPVEKGYLYVAAWELFRDMLIADDTNSIALATMTQLRHPTAKLSRMPGSKPEPTLPGPALKTPELMAGELAASG
jgi:hypothetical protein